MKIVGFKNDRFVCCVFLTNKRVLHTPLVGWNHLFQCFNMFFHLFLSLIGKRKVRKKKTIYIKGIYQRLGVKLGKVNFTSYGTIAYASAYLYTTMVISCKLTCIVIQLRFGWVSVRQGSWLISIYVLWDHLVSEQLLKTFKLPLHQLVHKYACWWVTILENKNKKNCFSI